jgi:hypothetical protein
VIQTTVQVQCDGCGKAPGLFRLTEAEAREDAIVFGFCEMKIDGHHFDLCGGCTPNLMQRAAGTHLTETDHA